METILDLLLHAFRYLVDYALFPGGSETISLMRLFSLLLAFSISGAMTVFLNQTLIIQYLGPNAPRRRAFVVASVSGVILAVCSCSVLPMFAGIRKKGAGLGPAMAFLVSGPAINVLALTLTTTDLGISIAMVRLAGAILLALGIGSLMALFFKENIDDSGTKMFRSEDSELTVREQGTILTLLLLMLVFGVYEPWITLPIVLVLIVYLTRTINRQQLIQWIRETGWLAKKILPLFIVGVFVAGVLDFVLRVEWVEPYLSGQQSFHFFIAAILGALMYFATLTEIPVVQSLMNSGMGQGPAITLLLAGPTVSIPNMLVIGRVLGTKKTVVYLSMLIVGSAIIGMAAHLIL
jgi:uncharacterized membrane protein YraQ (UPF0718 family)